MIFVYALYNKEKDTIYIGQSNNIERRLKEHNSSSKKHFTSKLQGKWELIYSESVASRSEAIKRENALKSYRGRQFIKNHIPE